MASKEATKANTSDVLHLDDLVSLLRRIELHTNTTDADNADPAKPDPSYCNTLPAGVRLNPKVRRCDWKRFKNEVATDTPCVVDTLVANSDLPLQVLDDEAQRGKYAANQLASEAEDLREKTGSSLVEEPWIHRVRIRSAAVLQLLGLAGGQKWDITKTHSLMRPFQYLILHQQRVRQYLEGLESEASACNFTPEVTAADGLDQGLLTAKDIIDEVRCYVGFVDNSLMPLYRQFEGAISPATEVRFDDLWYLFRPGELLYVDPKTSAFEHAHGKAALRASTMQRVGRIISASPPLPRVTGDGFFRSERRCGPKFEADVVGDGRNDDIDDFCIDLYFLDFDGDNFVPWYLSYAISPYSGSVRVESLRCYPLRFADAARNLLQQHIAQGKKFVECIKLKHLTFNGTAILYEPSGAEMLGFKGEPMVGPSRYSGEVYVDVKEAIRCNPYWFSWTHGYTLKDPVVEEIIETYPVQRRSYTEQSTESTAYREALLWAQDASGLAQGNAQRRSDRYLFEGTGVPLGLFPLQEEDLALLPRRLYVYLLRVRSFMAADIYDLQPILLEPRALDEISIDEDVKGTLKAVVLEHLERSRMLGGSKSSICQETSRGNNQGLVILLQGPPGTGKTATAEAIAHTYQRPLFVLDMGDLINIMNGGRDPLALAEAWDCVVLLDEVDTFLMYRNKQDVHSNSDISFLLRIIETFSGLLILTTCRPGVLDQGVKSRIHLNICLKALNLEQTVQIFKQNLADLKKIEQKLATPERRPLAILEGKILDFAERHFNSPGLDEGRWNGRQIRNAVRVAAAIARYQYLGTTAEPQLRPDHFQKVAELTKQYDLARRRAVRKTDTYLAWEKEERCDDDFQPGALPPRQRRQDRGQLIGTCDERDSRRSAQDLVKDNEDGQEDRGSSQAELLRRREKDYMRDDQWSAAQKGDSAATYRPQAEDWGSLYRVGRREGDGESGKARGEHFRGGY